MGGDGSLEPQVRGKRTFPHIYFTLTFRGVAELPAPKTFSELVVHSLQTLSDKQKRSGFLASGKELTSPVPRSGRGSQRAKDGRPGDATAPVWKGWPMCGAGELRSPTRTGRLGTSAKLAKVGGTYR